MVLWDGVDWYNRHRKKNPLIVYRFYLDSGIEILTIDDVTARNDLFTLDGDSLTFHRSKIHEEAGDMTVSIGKARAGMFIYGLRKKHFALRLYPDESSTEISG